MPNLAFGQVSVLHAVADGNRFGFEIMDATGLTSGSVYPTLDKLESLGYLMSHWEDVENGAPRQASAAPLLRPHAGRRRGARRRAQALQEPEARLARGVARPPERSMTPATGDVERRACSACCWRSSIPAGGSHRRPVAASGGGSGAPTSCTNGSGSRATHAASATAPACSAASPARSATRSGCGFTSGDSK